MCTNQFAAVAFINCKCLGLWPVFFACRMQWQETLPIRVFVDRVVYLLLNLGFWSFCCLSVTMICVPWMLKLLLRRRFCCYWNLMFYAPT